MTICDMLKKIRADVLAEECMNQINKLDISGDGKNEAHITNFLAAVSSLSIDIQMALYKEAGEGQESVEGKAIEKETPADDEEELQKEEITVLAVDDAAFYLNHLSMFLKNTRFKLVGLRSGYATLQYLENNSPSLFILDINMPEMDGYELAKEIRKRGHKAPIIFLTGNAEKEYVLKAIQAGAADFVVKPINKEQLLERINKFAK
jgi:PleD family two-component response regulator